MNEEKKIIKIDKETRLFLLKEFKVTNVCLWNALTYRRNNALAKRIRQAALNRGGTLYKVTKDIILEVRY